MLTTDWTNNVIAYSPSEVAAKALDYSELDSVYSVIADNLFIRLQSNETSRHQRIAVVLRGTALAAIQ